MRHAYGIARSSIVADADGQRRATIIVPPNTTSSMTLPDGSTQALTSLSIRATEFTVGPNGPKAMPAPLPPMSAYTYCVELTADEAVAANATRLTFNQAVPVYIDNFLGFATGIRVPLGYYDRVRGVWVAVPDGRVVRIVSIVDGRAYLDIDGDGLADDATTIGVTDGEREQLATLYAVNQSLWRLQVDHFTPYDPNWIDGAASTAVGPLVPKNPPPKSGAYWIPGCDRCGGSIIEVQNQSLGERFGIAGTPLSLHYTSDRQQGRLAARTLNFQVTGSTVPPGLQSVTVSVEAEGRSLLTQVLQPAIDQKLSVTWDGLDAYGRTVRGAVPVKITTTYTYPAVYFQPGAMYESSFGLPPTDLTPLRAARAGLLANQFQTSRIGVWEDRGTGLGGLSIDVHHVYDPVHRILYMGDGTQRSADTNGAIVTHVAGTGTYGESGDGGPAALAQVYFVAGLAVGPDGSVYIADERPRVRRIGPDGVITRFAGSDGSEGNDGDGGPALNAHMGHAEGVAVGPDGSVYIADDFYHTIRKVDPHGIITTVAGTGQRGLSPDGTPAVQAQLRYPSDVAVGPDGSIYIADQDNFLVRRVGTDGIITTIAGDGTGEHKGDGGPATQAGLYFPLKLDVGADGSIYVTSSTPGYIRKIAPDGTISTVAGSGYGGSTSDGIPATDYELDYPTDIVASADGSFLVSEPNEAKIHQVSADGIIATLAGDGTWGALGGDGGAPSRAQIWDVNAMATAPDGSIYFASFNGHAIKKVSPPVP